QRRRAAVVAGGGLDHRSADLRGRRRVARGHAAAARDPARLTARPATSAGSCTDQLRTPEAPGWQSHAGRHGSLPGIRTHRTEEDEHPSISTRLPTRRSRWPRSRTPRTASSSWANRSPLPWARTVVWRPRQRICLARLLLWV